MRKNVIIEGVPLTADVAKLVELTGASPSVDVERIKDGTFTRELLLAYCLNGADDDYHQAWHDYVDAIMLVATTKRASSTRYAIFAAIDVAYNHGYKPKPNFAPIDEYADVVAVLGREPTQEESAFFAEVRLEGYKKRAVERLKVASLVL